jgi:uncharacterized OsmC-like protein
MAVIVRRKLVGKELNGIAERERAELQRKLGDVEQVKEFSGPWTARVTWRGGFAAQSKVRRHTIEFDEPAAMEADDSAASAHEYLLSALGACLITGFVLHATTERVRLDSVELSLTGSFDNILRWAGLSATGNPGYRSIQVTAQISGDADEDQLRNLWDRAVAGSPVMQTITNPTPVFTVMQVVPSQAADPAASSAGREDRPGPDRPEV